MDFMFFPQGDPRQHDAVELGLNTDIRDPIFFWQHCMHNCGAVDRPGPRPQVLSPQLRNQL